jgi:adenylate kinase family enzyme
MERIVIIGCSGSGKSTLARELGRRLGLPVTHLDALHWQPGWKPHPDMEGFSAQIRQIAQGERWIIDGGYTTGNIETRLARADTYVLMDFPTWLCLFRVVWRAIEFRGQQRPDMAPGCPEGRFDPAFFNYVRTYKKRRLPKREQEIAQHFDGRVIRLRSSHDVRDFLATLPP